MHEREYLCSSFVRLVKTRSKGELIIEIVSDNPIVVESVPEFGYNPFGYIESEV